MKVGIYITILLFAILTFGIFVNASELPASPSDYQNMKIDDIVKLSPEKFDTMISSPEGVQRVNNDEVWGKIGDDKKDKAFQKDFGGFEEHANSYFGDKMGVEVKGLDLAGSHVKYDGQMLTTNEGNVKLGLSEIPSGTKSLEVRSNGMTLTNEANNKLTVNAGTISKDGSVILNDGRKVYTYMDEYSFSGGQEVMIGDISGGVGPEYNLVQFKGADAKASIVFEDFMGQRTEFSKGSLSGEGRLFLRGGEYSVENIRLQTVAADLDIGKSTKLYFDDINRFSPNRADMWNNELRATENQFVQLTESRNLNIQGRDMEVTVNEPMKVTVQGERVLVNDNGNKIRFEGMDTKQSWANPEDKTLMGSYKNTFDDWNMHNAEMNMKVFTEPISEVVSFPVKAGMQVIGNTGKGVWSFFTGIGDGVSKMGNVFQGSAKSK